MRIKAQANSGKYTRSIPVFAYWYYYISATGPSMQYFTNGLTLH